MKKLRELREIFRNIFIVKKFTLKPQDTGLVNGYYPNGFKYEMIMLNHIRKYGVNKVEINYYDFYLDNMYEYFSMVKKNLISLIKRHIYLIKTEKYNYIKTIFKNKKVLHSKQNKYFKYQLDEDLKYKRNYNKNLTTEPSFSSVKFSTSLTNSSKDRKHLLETEKKLIRGEYIPPQDIFKSVNYIENLKALPISDDQNSNIMDRICYDSINKSNLSKELKKMLNGVHEPQVHQWKNKLKVKTINN